MLSDRSFLTVLNFLQSLHLSILQIQLFLLITLQIYWLFCLSSQICWEVLMVILVIVFFNYKIPFCFLKYFVCFYWESLLIDSLLPCFNSLTIVFFNSFNIFKITALKSLLNLTSGNTQRFWLLVFLKEGNTLPH